MAPTTTTPPALTVREKLDIIPAQLSVVAAGLYAAIAGIFRGKSGAKTYSKHIAYAVTRRFFSRISPRQSQYLSPISSGMYETYAKEKGFEPLTVELNHGAQGSWLGSEDAKNVVVYYHGGAFGVSANIGYFRLFSDLVDDLNAAGKDVAFLFLTYSLAPGAKYPTQIRQAVEALRYVVHDLQRAPSDVFIAGDSAGGNLTFNVLSHLSHPHPDIEPLELSEPLAGAVTIAPWVSYSVDYPSMQQNIPKDILLPSLLKELSEAYKGDAPPDNYNEPARAPADWWRDLRVNQLLVVVGRDEVLLDSIEEFVKKLKSVFPNTSYLVAEDEPHTAPIVHRVFGDKQETLQGKEIRSWLSARL